MGKLVSIVLLLAGFTTYLIGAAGGLPRYLVAVTILAATAMISSGVYMLIHEEQLLR